MAKTLEDFEKNPASFKEVRNWAEEIMGFIFTRSQENLIQNKSVDTEFLMRSGKPPIWNGNIISIEYDAPYAMPVEYGQVAHSISHKVLIGWVRRKLRIKGKRGISVSWAISQTIKQKGVIPRPFIRPAINEAIVRYNLKAKQFDISDQPGQESGF